MYHLGARAGFSIELTLVNILAEGTTIGDHGTPVGRGDFESASRHHKLPASSSVRTKVLVLMLPSLVAST